MAGLHIRQALGPELVKHSICQDAFGLHTTTPFITAPVSCSCCCLQPCKARVLQNVAASFWYGRAAFAVDIASHACSTRQTHSSSCELQHQWSWMAFMLALCTSAPSAQSEKACCKTLGESHFTRVFTPGQQ